MKTSALLIVLDLVMLRMSYMHHRPELIVLCFLMVLIEGVIVGMRLERW